MCHYICYIGAKINIAIDAVVQYPLLGFSVQGLLLTILSKVLQTHGIQATFPSIQTESLIISERDTTLAAH